MPPYVYCKNEGPHSAHSWLPNSKRPTRGDDVYHWCPGLRSDDEE